MDLAVAKDPLTAEKMKGDMGENIRIGMKEIFTGGDQITHYEAGFVDCEPTYSEFIKWIKGRDEWGYVRIRDFGTVEYSHGRIVDVNLAGVIGNFDRIILHGIDSGGTRTDYDIELEYCKKLRRHDGKRTL